MSDAFGDVGWEGGLVAKDRRGRRRPAPPKRGRADHHFVEQAPHRPDVAALVRQPVLHLLRREIRRRPEHLALARQRVVLARLGPPFRDAEVDEDDAPVRREEQIRGLEIAVDDPGVVRGDERLRGLDGVADRELRRQRAALDDHAFVAISGGTILRTTRRPSASRAR